MTFSVHHFPVVDSTMDEAVRQMRDGAPSGTVIMADAQTKGRGRHGRTWETPSGNLAATLVWYLNTSEKPGDYSIIVALAIADAVTHYVPHADVQMKWPNDIFMGGRKCAGILIEVPESGVLLIGTGVNIAHAPEGRAKILDDADISLSSRDVLDIYTARFLYWVERYRAEGMAPLVTAWMDRAYGLGGQMRVRLPREEFTARFEGLAPDGAAVAVLENGEKRLIYAGEVFFDV